MAAADDSYLGFGTIFQKCQTRSRSTDCSWFSRISSYFYIFSFYFSKLTKRSLLLGLLSMVVIAVVGGGKDGWGRCWWCWGGVGMVVMVVVVVFEVEVGVQLLVGKVVPPTISRISLNCRPLLRRSNAHLIQFKVFTKLQWHLQLRYMNKCSTKISCQQKVWLKFHL